MKIEGYKILSCNQWGVGVFGGADYDGEKVFCINEPCDIILTQWGKFCHMSCMPKHEVVGSI